MPAVVIFVNIEYLSVVLTKETETLIVTVTNKLIRVSLNVN